MNGIQPLHLLLKALGLFVLANLLFALWNPPVGRLSVYNLLFPGRERFPFGAGVADSNITVDDLDAMFTVHIISAPKRADELRVVILGDSSVWGSLLHADQTLAAQLNKSPITCAGKTLRFYNLGFPHPSVLQDLLIMQAAMQYQPDMIVWIIAPNSLRPKTLNPFLTSNLEQVRALVREYRLRQRLPRPQPETFFEQTIVGQRSHLARLLLLQSLAVLWAATGVDIPPVDDHPKLSNDLPSSLALGALMPPANIRRLLLLDHLEAGTRLSAGVPILFVNQPMFIGTGNNSDRRYNAMFPRWAYDQYRRIIARQAGTHQWAYLDLWNVVPPEDFTDYELHLSARGEERMAEAMQAAVQQVACP